MLQDKFNLLNKNKYIPLKTLKLNKRGLGPESLGLFHSRGISNMPQIAGNHYPGLSLEDMPKSAFKRIKPSQMHLAESQLSGDYENLSEKKQEKFMQRLFSPKDYLLPLKQTAAVTGKPTGFVFTGAIADEYYARHTGNWADDPVAVIDLALPMLKPDKGLEGVAVSHKTTKKLFNRPGRINPEDIVIYHAFLQGGEMSQQAGNFNELINEKLTVYEINAPQWGIQSFGMGTVIVPTWNAEFDEKNPTDNRLWNAVPGANPGDDPTFKPAPVVFTSLEIIGLINGTTVEEEAN
jgi:hypothetical protein